MPSRKRQATDDDGDTPAGSPSEVGGYSSVPPSSLPPSSPPAPPFDDDAEDIDEDHALDTEGIGGNDDLIDDLDEQAEEEDGIDLFGDSLEKDYENLDQNNTYNLGARDIDDEDYDDIDLDERRRVDQLLNRRDRVLQRNRGLPDAFLDDDDIDLELPTHRRRRNAYDEDPDLSDEDPMMEEISLNALADMKAPTIAEWVTQPATHRSIAREFKNFLFEYIDENGKSVYGARIRTLGEVNSESLEVSYQHLVEAKSILARFLLYAPAEMLKIFDVVAMEVTELHYPDYSRIHLEIHVRISDIPNVRALRDLREAHLGQLVCVTGVVTRRTGVFPQLKYVKFNCSKCNTVLGPFFQESDREVRVSYCHNCQAHSGFTINTEKTVYRNYQKVTLQESPGTVPAGRLPRHREVILLWDLIDSAKPGEEVEVTGIYKNSYDGQLNARNGFPVFTTVLEANLVKRRDERSNGKTWTEEDEQAIRALSRRPTIIKDIIASIAPSIYGHDDIKTAIACSLFGGVPKDINGKHSIRGDINVLLLGDPGTAKSQFLKYSEKTAHRAVFATGQGASAVGLTASVRRDPITNEWTLEGGALVLADKGVCLIDEFDKMNDQDRTSIHEAMEQQSISISKAGIVTTLQARCAIIAAANPTGGRYNSTVPFSQNVNLTEPILSRFDVLCVVRDVVDPKADGHLARFVIDSHSRSHPDGEGDDEDDEDEDEEMADEDEDEDMDDDDTSVKATPRQRRPNKAAAATPRSFASTPGRSTASGGRKPAEAIAPIAQDLLAKYMHYAKEKVRPRLLNVDQDKISRLYADMRRESLATGSYPITVRHLESILRLSEAFAKMRLSEYVAGGDIDRAIKVTIQSFVGAQKVSVKKSLQRSFMKYMLGGER
ncbi:MCM2/3/5 family-domain-containing protein [Limtongia smithiae]|uniref:MCM2/3/5 family-domain-containing protein n=1 Tax=Limtongia smithiae TaxID=1125753 RepID=UPI0034CD9EA3